MSLKLMYITNNPAVAQIAETAGVDRIFVDMEYIGKAERQGGMDTVKNHHSIEDVRAVSEAVTEAEILVRINPIHDAADGIFSTEEEINGAIENGADILMLPYFKTVDEVRTFLKIVDRRVKTIPLVETPEAVEVIDEILTLDIDEIFIGLNDLSLGYKKKFMFELLADGTVEELCCKFKKKGIPYGFGGIASLGCGMLPSEQIIGEHYRLGSSCVILSRSFCDIQKLRHVGKISAAFLNGVKEIREYEKKVKLHSDFFKNNQEEVKRNIESILETMA